MNRYAATLAATVAVTAALLTTGPAQADDTATPCTVTPLVAGECVTQPVADYVTLQASIIATLTADRDTAWASFRSEQAAHQETRLQLAAVNDRVAQQADRITKLQAKVRDLRAQLRNS